jgi:hypothetical protein
METEVYRWERLPEYVATQEYSRCLGRILASLPRLVTWCSAQPLTLAAVRLSAGIAGANAELAPWEELSPEERAAFRAQGLEGLRWSRRRLRRLQRWRLGDRRELRRALELLDEIENWIEAGPPVEGPSN